MHRIVHYTHMCVKRFITEIVAEPAPNRQQTATLETADCSVSGRFFASSICASLKCYKFKRFYRFGTLYKASRHWLGRVCIIIKSLARLAAIPARQHQSLQQRRRSEAALLEL